MAPDCSSDASKPIQAWLQQLSPGTTVDLAGACYQIDRGVTVRFVQGLTIEDGTIEDLNNTPAVNTGHGTPHGQPMFDVLGGSDVSFENLTMTGINRGGYHPRLAFQAAIELDGTIGAMLSGLTISKTFGDGINLEPLRGASDHKSGHIVNPCEDVSIANVVIRGAGRQGITLASVDGVTITNVTIRNAAMDAFDFEADQNNEGAKNVLIDGCSFSQLLNISMQGTQTGPITVENCVMPEADSGWAVNIRNTKGRSDAGPILFDDDTFNCGASVYVACYDLDGATNLTIENSTATIGYPHDEIHEHAYRAVNNTNATFVNDTVSGYGILGGVSANSSVDLVGGSWSPIHFGPTTTTLVQSGSSVTYGAETTDFFAVTVDGGKSPAPTGTVTVADTATESPICVAALVPASGSTSTGSCTASPAEFDGGTAFATVAATYYGDGNYSDSQSSPLQIFTVDPASTTTTLSQSMDWVSFGTEGADSFEVVVAGQGPLAPSGWVHVEDAATQALICTAVLAPSPGDSAADGTCSPDDSQFPSGTSFSSVTAVYGGDDDNVGSTSSPSLTFTVDPASTDTTLSQSADSVSFGSESADSFEVDVTGQGPDVAPSGPVDVEDAATLSLICTVVLAPNPDNSASGTCSPGDTEFPSGTSFSSVTAVYGGDGNFAGSASGPAQIFSVTDPTSGATQRRSGPRARTANGRRM